jgi:hypothetical protein
MDALTSRRRIPFNRQSVRSNYCGVYAAGMFLSLLGVPTDRRRALRLFGLATSNRDYAGTPLDQIGRFLKRQGFATRARWHRLPIFDVERARRVLSRWLSETRRPTLVAFGAVHRRTQLRCRHIAVVTGVTRDAILLLDPLGRPPSGAAYNVRIGPSGRAAGSFYAIVRRLGLDLLDWTPGS